MALPTHTIGEAYTSTTAWELLERLVDLETRMAGTDGERAGAELIAGRLRDHGLRDVAVEPFEVPGWRRGSASIRLDAAPARRFERSHEILALPRSPAGTVEAELVDLGDGAPTDFDRADLEDRIALVSSRSPNGDRWIHRTEKYHRAIDAGAAAFVFRGVREGCLPPTGNVGTPDGPGEIPAVGVSKEVGNRLVRRSTSGTGAALEVQCHNETVTSRNVHGVLGPDTGQEVLLTAHHDAHDISEGALDNGAGCALVVEVARLLTTVDDLPMRVRVVTFGAEEFGMLGDDHWIDAHGIDDIAAVVNVDGAGSSRTVELHTQGFEVIGDAFETAAVALDVPLHAEPGLVPWSDHWPFVRRGVPGAFVSSRTEGESLRGWGHTHGDTLDKLDPRDLRALAVTLAAGTLELCRREASLEAVPEARIRDAAIEQNHDVGMRVTGEWPWA